MDSAPPPFLSGFELEKTTARGPRDEEKKGEKNRKEQHSYPHHPHNHLNSSIQILNSMQRVRLMILSLQVMKKG